MISKAKKKKPTASTPSAPQDKVHIPHHTMMPYKFEPYQPKADEIYMNEQQLAHFRAILEAWKKELMNLKK